MRPVLIIVSIALVCVCCRSLPPQNDILGAQLSPDKSMIAIRVSDKEVVSRAVHGSLAHFPHAHTADERVAQSLVLTSRVSVVLSAQKVVSTATGEVLTARSCRPPLV